jgi:hypothetical protein
MGQGSHEKHSLFPKPDPVVSLSFTFQPKKPPESQWANAAIQCPGDLWWAAIQCAGELCWAAIQCPGDLWGGCYTVCSLHGSQCLAKRCSSKGSRWSTQNLLEKTALIRAFHYSSGILFNDMEPHNTVLVAQECPWQVGDFSHIAYLANCNGENLNQ